MFCYVAGSDNSIYAVADKMICAVNGESSSPSVDYHSRVLYIGVFMGRASGL